MNPNLFKSAEFYHRRHHNFATFLILPSVLLVSFLVIFALFAKKEITITSQGELTPTKVIASVQSTSDHTIVVNNLKNNKFIKKGDVIIQYSKTMENSQKKALEKRLATLNKQKNGLQILRTSLEQETNLFKGEDEFGYSDTFNHFFKQSQDIITGIAKKNAEVNNQASLANHAISVITSQLDELHQKITDYEELKQAINNQEYKLSPDNPHQTALKKYQTQFQTQEDNSALKEEYLSQISQNISELESSMANLNIQRASTGNLSLPDTSHRIKIDSLKTQFLQNTSQQLTTVENQITELKDQIEQANIQLKNNIIIAPETGTIHLNSEFEGKSLIPNGSEVAQIYPDIQKIKEVFITYYVTSEHVSLLKEKQGVRLSLEKVGNQTLTINGTIQTIDKSATKTDQGNLFKVTALSKLSNKDSDVVQYGLQGRVTSVVTRKSYFNYYKDKILNSFN